jgi:hypothetical protein
MGQKPLRVQLHVLYAYFGVLRPFPAPSRAGHAFPPPPGILTVAARNILPEFGATYN